MKKENPSVEGFSFVGNDVIFSSEIFRERRINMNEYPISEKLLRELNALNSTDYLSPNGKNLFPTVKEGEIVIGVCPQFLISLFVLARKKYVLKKQREKSLKDLEQSSLSARQVGKLLQDIQMECDQLQLEFDLCMDVFWIKLSEEFPNEPNNDEQNIALRANGLVVRYRPASIEEIKADVFEHLEKRKRDLHSKYN